MNRAPSPSPSPLETGEKRFVPRCRLSCGLLSAFALSGVVVLIGLLPARLAGATTPELRQRVQVLVNREYASLFDLYRHFHADPELSFQEVKTAARLGEELKRARFEVTTNVGGHGVVGVLRNGEGPTLLLRTDIDALPVKENTGLPYASTARAVDDGGIEVDVMHACGHDVHMTVLSGTARVLNELKDRWQGTLVLIGQPAEERGAGAKAMLADGLFTRFPKPDCGLALHVKSEVPVGAVAFTEGYALANVDSADVTVYGIGGHGSAPHTTRDPVVLAAQIVLALQTIVSREIAPGEPAVVTVGSIHGGTKHNIIPDEVRLQLTLRSYSNEVRAQTIAAIRRIVRGAALAAGLPEDRLPVVKISGGMTPATYNDPRLTARLARLFKEWFGEENAIPAKPDMGGEDFGQYGRTEDHIPISMFWLGAGDPAAARESLKTGRPLPSTHSSLFAPVPEPTIKTGVTAMTAAALELLGKGNP